MYVLAPHSVSLKVNQTKMSMYHINIQIGEPKTAFTSNLADYCFLKTGFKVLKQL